CSVEKMIT
ncbi:hypothetical protein D030_3872B, partial [Vibrio parahaemolyticus AQ3810]